MSFGGPNFLEEARALLLYSYVCARVPCQFPNKFFLFFLLMRTYTVSFYAVVQQLASSKRELFSKTVAFQKMTQTRVESNQRGSDL